MCSNSDLLLARPPPCIFSERQSGGGGKARPWLGERPEVLRGKIIFDLFVIPPGSFFM